MQPGDMASRPRRFEANRPVLITIRCTLRLELLALEGMLELFLRMLATYAGRCEVDVFAWTVQSNHAHLIVRQRRDGHDPERRTGIAAFMRNVASVVALHGNARGTFQGRFLERTYRSHSIGTVADLVRYLAYVHGQREHHRVRGDAHAGAPSSSAGAVLGGLPDGIVELVPGEPLCVGQTFEARCEWLRTLVARVVELAVPEERRAEALDVPGTTLTRRQLKSMRRDAWRAAVDRASAELGLVGMDADACTVLFRPLRAAVGLAACQAARERVLAAEWVRNEPDRRRPPKVGSMIRVRVTYVNRPTG